MLCQVSYHLSIIGDVLTVFTVHFIIAHRSVPGGIATIDEQGHLSVQYLGTDPAMMVMPSTQYRETKYDDFADQIKKYQQIIRENSSKKGLDSFLASILTVVFILRHVITP